MGKILAQRDREVAGDGTPLRSNRYCVIHELKCTAQQERQRKNKKWLNRFPVLVDGIVYPEGGWMDPFMRSKKEELPPWIPHDIAGTGWGKSRGATQYPSVKFQNDGAKIWLEEKKRLLENKMTRFEVVVEEELLTGALSAEAPTRAQEELLRFVEQGNKCGHFRVHHLPKPPKITGTQEENKMEDEIDEDVSYSGEKWPLLNEEPRGKQYITVQVYLCEAQHEWQLEKWFDLCPVQVDGKIYPREEWNDPGLRKMKSLLPPWLQHPSERSSEWNPSERSHGMVVDYEEIFREEDRRMKENKMTRFVFLVEEDRRAEAETWFPEGEIQSEEGARWVEDEPSEVGTRRGRANGAAQQETVARAAVEAKEAQQDELFFLDYQGEREEHGDAVHTIQEDDLKSVLKATESMVLVERPRLESAAGMDDETKTARKEEPGKKHPSDTPQTEDVKRLKTEEETEDKKVTDANEGSASISADSHQRATGEQEAMDTSGNSNPGDVINVGEGVGGEDTVVEVTMVGSMWPGGPMLVLPSGEDGPQQRKMLRQWGLSWEGMENDTEVHQNSATTRKTRDGGDPQTKDHTSESGRGGK